jgi:hypothetical protein
VIILDEQLQGRNLEKEIASWYGGAVRIITDLRPGTVIKDDAIPQLLCQLNKPTFVTINVTDFWGKLPADTRYCAVCFAMKDSEVPRITGLLRILFSHEKFRTKSLRAGYVVRMTHDAAVRYYKCNHRETYEMVL